MLFFVIIHQELTRSKPVTLRTFLCILSAVKIVASHWPSSNFVYFHWFHYLTYNLSKCCINLMESILSPWEVNDNWPCFVLLLSLANTNDYSTTTVFDYNGWTASAYPCLTVFARWHGSKINIFSIDTGFMFVGVNKLEIAELMYSLKLATDIYEFSISPSYSRTT